MATYHRAFSPRDLFAEMGRLQRELLQAFDLSPSIRGLSRGFPALNVGGTPWAVHVYAFAPGMDPASMEVYVEKGVLTIAGERQAEPAPENATRHIDERYAGRFRRVISLPDDIDASQVSAAYRDGVLHVRIPRKEEAQPRRIAIQ